MSRKVGKPIADAWWWSGGAANATLIGDSLNRRTHLDGHVSKEDRYNAVFQVSGVLGIKTPRLSDHDVCGNRSKCYTCMSARDINMSSHGRHTEKLDWKTRIALIQDVDPHCVYNLYLIRQSWFIDAFDLLTLTFDISDPKQRLVV